MPKANLSPKANAKAPSGPTSPKPGLGAAGNVVACVGVGGLLGFGADWAMGTTPWGLIIGLFLGFAAWLRELWLLLKA